MNLQKNDKIIAVVGVLILVIAAIGVIFYYPFEDEVDTIEPDEDELLRYTVDYEIDDNIITPDNTDFSVKDKIIGSKDYIGTFEVSSNDLKNIEIFIDYFDTRMGKLTKMLSEDILYVTVYDESETEIDSFSIQGEGNNTIAISGGPAQSFGIIYASDIDEAKQKLEDNMSSSGGSEKYTIEVSIKNGESGLKAIFRPLRWILEKIGSDSFTLEITSYHYKYMINEPEREENGDGGDDDDEMSNRKYDYSTASYNYMSNTGFN